MQYTRRAQTSAEMSVLFHYGAVTWRMIVKYCYVTEKKHYVGEKMGQKGRSGGSSPIVAWATLTGPKFRRNPFMIFRVIWRRTEKQTNRQTDKRTEVKT